MNLSQEAFGAEVISIDEAGGGCFVILSWNSNEIPPIMNRRPSFTDFDLEFLGDVEKGFQLYPNADRVFVMGACKRKIGDRIPLKKICVEQ